MVNFAGFVTVSPQRFIDSFVAQVTLSEAATDELQITSSPIENGASISDHAFKKPAQVVIKCGWSNASLGGLEAGLDGLISSVEGQGSSSADYVSGIYSKLLALQESRVLFDLSTGKRRYSNMLMSKLEQTTDATNENALIVTATCQEVRVVMTQITTLPAKENQASPELIAEVSPTGGKQLIAANPAPGGSYQA